MSPQDDRSGASWKRHLKLVLAAVLLGVVAWQLPWTDRVEWVAGADAEVLSVEGEILGDWTEERIEFRPSAGAGGPPGWPEESAERLAAGEAVTVERDADAEDGHFDWKPGMPRALRDMDPTGLLVALALFVAGGLAGVTRWWRLLAVCGCVASWLNTLRLTFLGLFFNLVVPGLTGGDVVKAVIVVRENPGRRSEAFLSVVVDRLIGLVVLAALAAVAILVMGEAFAPLRAPVLAFLGLAVAGGLVYVNPTLRRLARFESLLARLPFGDKLRMLDEGVLVYSRHPGTLALACVLSLGNHVAFCAGVWVIGNALGVRDLHFGHYLAVVPIVNIATALPATPGGWGVGEALYGYFFAEVLGSSAALGVAVSVCFRLCMMIMNLSGGLFLFLPGPKVDLHEIEEELREEGESDGGRAA